jgi:hypothetical protein
MPSICTQRHCSSHSMAWTAPFGARMGEACGRYTAEGEPPHARARMSTTKSCAEKGNALGNKMTCQRCAVDPLERPDQAATGPNPGMQNRSALRPEHEWVRGFAPRR